MPEFEIRFAWSDRSESYIEESLRHKATMRIKAKNKLNAEKKLFDIYNRRGLIISIIYGVEEV